MAKKIQKIVLKIGGSLLFDSDLNVRLDQVRKFASILQKSSDIIAVVIGGGKIARTYITAARKVGAGESLCDTFGIEVSRINARLLISALGDGAFSEPVRNLTEIRQFQHFHKIMVAGGFVPGQSTTSVTLQIAEALGATDVLVLTNTDGIYNKDPNKFADAVKYDTITIKELEKVILGGGGATQAAAGEYRIFDAVSMQILKRSHFAVKFANGENLDELHTLLADRGSVSPIGTDIVRE